MKAIATLFAKSFVIGSGLITAGVVAVITRNILSGYRWDYLLVSYF